MNTTNETKSLPLDEVLAKVKESTWLVGGIFPDVAVLEVVDGGCGGEYPEPVRYGPVCEVVTYPPGFVPKGSERQLAIETAAYIAHAANVLPGLVDAIDKLTDYIERSPALRPAFDTGWDHASAHFNSAVRALAAARKVSVPS